MVASSDPSIWGTWEDLLLASAVRRHGANFWDSVAAELRLRSSYGHLLNPRSCRLRFIHLHRRFSTGNPFADTMEPRSDVPWLEDLRRLRVAELRRDVQRYDASIMSLQKRVRRLSEGCETGGETPGSGAGDPDRISCRSSKESNTADQGQDIPREPDPSADGSCHGSTATEAKESGDAQSSGTLTKPWRLRPRKEPLPETKPVGGPPAAETTKIESQPLMSFLEMLTSDGLCSVFVRKLESQMSEGYVKMIRRHVDLEMVRKKLLGEQEEEEGNCTYTAMHLYCDLLLLCNNAIVFFPEGSRECIAALRLRQLATLHHRTTMPTLLACRRQGSGSVKITEEKAAQEPAKVKVKVKDKKEKVARETRTKKGRSSGSNLTEKKRNKVRTSAPAVGLQDEKKKKKSGRQPAGQAKRGATAVRQHVQPVKKRIASSAPASAPTPKRARKAPETKRTAAKPPLPAAAKKPRPRKR